MTPDLASLARKFVTLSDELDSVREDIKRCVLNGMDPDPIRPTLARSRPGKAAKAKVSRAAKPKAAKASKPPPQDGAEAKPERYAERMRLARIADEEMVTMLRSQPGMRTGEIRRATEQRPSTLGERLKRLARQGRVERSGGGWAATSPG
jgi:hypothetical protein